MKQDVRDLKEDLIAENKERATTKMQSVNEEKSSYRQIFKATSLFGGVQVFNIIIGIVRVKFVAVLLGTTGVGIMGLLNAPIQLIISITGLGIAFSAVRDVSEAHGNSDMVGIAKSVMTLRRWAWLTGLLGSIVTISLAPVLSKWSFGNADYTWAFVWLSVTLLLYSLTEGQKAILQGTRRLKDLAKAGVLGSALGLVTAIPLYYFYGLEGIVPSMIASSIIALILSWNYSRKVSVQNVHLSLRETRDRGFDMAKLGVSMTLAGFLASLSTYLLSAFISNHGGVEQVGLYNAGWGVVGQYTGIVFTAMATDYFPRLSVIQSDNQKIRVLVSQQAEAALLIMAPLLALLIVTMPLAVRVLYTEAFLPIVMFANLTVLGMQFKAVSWAMGYVFLAKGDGRIFLILEIVSGILILTLNLLFYYFYGLNGLGVSFILSFIIGSLIGYLVLNRKYGFFYPKKFYGRFATTYGLVLMSFLSVFILNVLVKYIVGICLLVLIVLYSYGQLNKMIDIKQMIRDRLKRK
ncbi:MULTISPECIES: O-antigen translocase [unclassified Carboxylicivirga]|uniref:O-antigen translocase n=1 Tax=Carboxylicivirga TaxID=1628153 RepID=UPI003D3469FB